MKCSICDFESDNPSEFFKDPLGRFVCPSCDYFLSLSDQKENYDEDPYPEE